MSTRENKKKKKSDIIFKIITVILLCVMVFSAYKVVSILLEYHNGKSAYDALADIAGTGKSAGAGILGSSGEDDPEFLDINWEALMAKGSDVKGWLRSRGTSINYPVVQGSDNDYYLTHIMTGESSRYGSLFIDYRCEDPFNCFMTVIYGHRMMNDSMFNRLGDYFDDADYARTHPIMQLYTPDCNYYLEIFGAMHVDANNTSVYDMFIPEDDSAARQAYIDMILAGNELAGYSGGVSVSGSDRIVMMSTCTYDYDDDRIVVWGKLTPMNSSAGSNAQG